MVTSNLKIISIKNVFTCSLTFIHPKNGLFDMKPQKSVR